MEQRPKRDFISVEVAEETRRWLEKKVAERFEQGRRFGERSMGSVIRDVLDEQRKREQDGVAA